MLEKPNLPEEKVVVCLGKSYGIATAALNFLPIGNVLARGSIGFGRMSRGIIF
jgi:hypothetical protein